MQQVALTVLPQLLSGPPSSDRPIPSQAREVLSPSAGAAHRTVTRSGGLQETAGRISLRATRSISEEPKSQNIAHPHHRGHVFDHAVLQHRGHQTGGVLRKDAVLLRRWRGAALSGREKRVNHAGTDLVVREVQSSEQKRHQLRVV